MTSDIARRLLDLERQLGDVPNPNLPVFRIIEQGADESLDEVRARVDGLDVKLGRDDTLWVIIRDLTRPERTDLPQVERDDLGPYLDSPSDCLTVLGGAGMASRAGERPGEPAAPESGSSSGAPATRSVRLDDEPSPQPNVFRLPERIQ